MPANRLLPMPVVFDASQSTIFFLTSALGECTAADTDSELCLSAYDCGPRIYFCGSFLVLLVCRFVIALGLSAVVVNAKSKSMVHVILDDVSFLSLVDLST